jgi:hypothetical protein
MRGQRHGHGNRDDDERHHGVRRALQSGRQRELHRRPRADEHHGGERRAPAPGQFVTSPRGPHRRQVQSAPGDRGSASLHARPDEGIPAARPRAIRAVGDPVGDAEPGEVLDVQFHDSRHRSAQHGPHRRVQAQDRQECRLSARTTPRTRVAPARAAMGRARP